MYVGIVGGDAASQEHFKKIDQCLEKLIAESGVYLFTMFSAGIKGSTHTARATIFRFTRYSL